MLAPGCNRNFSLNKLLVFNYKDMFAKLTILNQVHPANPIGIIPYIQYR